MVTVDIKHIIVLTTLLARFLREQEPESILTSELLDILSVETLTLEIVVALTPLYRGFLCS